MKESGIVSGFLIRQPRNRGMMRIDMIFFMSDASGTLMASL
jgi:hypothetical protein